ncbi:hypothetical protein [Neobittarella massiliensis]|uniref:hypothetical protein n=1 Tax=Neobittarella massiliensis (ex Bilen et al. 2018) TaxID=2041842 RepID=UPI0013ECB46A|nr:hypothetical protein [Neobittarella massiliensis]
MILPLFLTVLSLLFKGGTQSLADEKLLLAAKNKLSGAAAKRRAATLCDMQLAGG